MLDKLLNYDNPVMSFLTFLGKMIVLNIMWIVCSLPVITIGASTTALYNVLFKIINHSDNYPFKTFLVTFKKEFKNATLVWLGFVVWFFVFIFDLYFGFKTTYAYSPVFTTLGMIGILVGFLVLLIIFPTMAKYSNSIKNYVVNSFKIICCSPGKTILIAIIWLLIIGSAIFVPNIGLIVAFIFPLCGFSLMFYFTALIMKNIYNKINK